jgi:hypothetical protein
MDDGVLCFDHVCIPREQLLMRFVHWPIFFWHFFVRQIYSDKYYVTLLKNVMVFSFRLSQVTREGKYVHSDLPKQLLYGTMV